MANSDGHQTMILIVEDIDWIRSGMKKAVERHGYRAVEATNDVEALEVPELASIKLIVTEEELPSFNTLMARLREHPTLSSVPVVIVNSDAEDGARHNDAYLLTDYSDIRSLLANLKVTRGSAQR